MKPDTTQARYFIAVVPPSPVREEAQALKEYFRDQYASKASLNSPPHITLHMPFLWKLRHEESLIQRLQTFAAGHAAFTLTLNNFGCFEPRVIFAAVQPSEPLHALQHALTRFCRRELNLFNADYQDRAFHPHLTLAFRDLKKSSFAEAWNDFQSRKWVASFHVDAITLLKHDGTRWNEHVHASLL